MPRPTIGIDARTFDYPDSMARGIGHYSLHHVRALFARRPEWDFILYTEFADPGAAAKGLERFSNVSIRAASTYRPADVDLVHLCDPMGFHYGYDSPFVVFRGARRLTVTFYDLIPLHLYFHSWSELMRRLYLRRLEQCVASGALCLAISAFTAEDLIRRTEMAADRTRVILAGLNTAARESDGRPPSDAAATLARLGVEPPFFLHVGALDPHKNFATVLAAFTDLRREFAAQLVVVGDKSGALARAAAQCASEGRRDVVFTGFIPRVDLENLYRGATALLCLSRFEGFGFPVLEAMAHGCPVIASCAASIPEVAGEAAAALLDPDDRVGVKAAMRELLLNPARAAELRCKGRAQAARFSWERTAEATLAAWEEMLAGAPAEPRKTAAAGRGRPEPPAARPRVLLDISVLGLSRLYPSARTGVFRVAENLARGLARSSEITLFFCATQSLSERAPDTVAACRRYLDETPDLRAVPFVAEELPEADIFHSPFHAIPDSARRCRRFLTVHDLLPLKHPHLFRAPMVERLRRLFARLDDDVRLFCTSEAVRAEVRRVLGAPDERVHIVSLAADPRVFYPCRDGRRIDAVRQRCGLPANRPYFLCLGTIEPRKNLPTVLDAFARGVGGGGGEEGPLLVIAGTAGWEVEGVLRIIGRSAVLRARTIVAGFIPDEELAPLYSGALAFVYPSLGEGFGLPPLEAMQCGTPVIVSNRPALPEVVGGAAIQLDPFDSHGLNRSLDELYRNADLRAAMSQRSLRQAARFSWDRFIRQTLEAYRISLDGLMPRMGAAACA